MTQGPQEPESDFPPEESVPPLRLYDPQGLPFPDRLREQRRPRVLPRSRERPPAPTPWVGPPTFPEPGLPEWLKSALLLVLFLGSTWVVCWLLIRKT